MSYVSFSFGALNIRGCRSNYKHYQGKDYLSYEGKSIHFKNTVHYKKEEVIVAHEKLSMNCTSRYEREKFFPGKEIGKMELVYLPEGVEPIDRNDSIITHLVFMFNHLKGRMSVTDEDTVIIVVPNHFEEIQLTLMKIAAEIVGFKKVEFVKEGLAIALSHLSYYQMMNPEPPGIYQYIDIGETHCTIHNVFVKDSTFTLISSTTSKEVSGYEMTKIIWKYIRELLDQDIESNEMIVEIMERENLTKEMLVNDQAFLKYLSLVLESKHFLSDKNCDEAPFNYDLDDNWELYINREEYEKRLEGMSEIFKSMLDEAFKKALVFAQQNNLPPTIRRIEVTGGAARTYLFMNIISQYITDHKQVYEKKTVSLTLTVECHSQGGIISRMKKAIEGKVCEDAVVKMETVQEKDVIATYIGEEKEKKTIKLLAMNSRRPVGERVELGTIVANPHHNILIKTVSATSVHRCLCEFITDEKDVLNMNTCSFTFYLDESEMIHCVMKTENGQQIELSKHMFVDNTSISVDGFFSCCEEVETASKSISAMVSMDPTNYDSYTKKLWEMKKNWEGKEIESSVTERVVYNFMDDCRFRAVGMKIKELRNQMDNLISPYYNQTSLDTIMKEFKDYQNCIDNKKSGFLPKMQEWIQYAEGLENAELREVMEDEYKLMEEIILLRSIEVRNRMK